MKYCDNCGKELKQSEKFCPQCGNNLNKKTVVYNVPPQPRDNAIAIIGFILSLTGVVTCGTFTIPSIVVSIIGFCYRKKYDKPRNGFTISSLIINAIVVLLYILMFIFPFILIAIFAFFGIDQSTVVNSMPSM